MPVALAVFRLQAAVPAQLDVRGVLIPVGWRVVDLAGSDVHDHLDENVGVTWALA
jgi:hypothetical protein